MANVESSFYGTAISTRGTPLVGQSVAICSQPANTSTTPCSPLVTTYTDITGSTPTGTPGITTTDSFGNFHFYLPSGIYTVQIYGPQVASPLVQVDTFVPIGTSSSNTFTGTVTFNGPTFLNTPCKVSNERYVDAPNTCNWSGGTVILQIVSACNDATANGTTSGIVKVQPGTGAGLPSTAQMPAGCTLIDERGLAGSGGIGYFKSLPPAGTYDSQTQAYFFLYNVPDHVNGRCIEADTTNLVGIDTNGSNIAPIVGLCTSTASACVDGTNYGGQATLTGTGITGGVYTGTVSCTGTSCTGSGTNFSTGTCTPSSNMCPGNWVTPINQRTIACARQIQSVGSSTTFTIDKDFSQNGPGGLACPTGANPSGITLVLLSASAAVHGEGILAATEGSIGSTSGVGPGALNVPAIANAGRCGPNVAYCIGIMGYSPAGPAGQFTKGVNGSQLFVDPVANPFVVSIQDVTTTASASGQEVLRIGAKTAGGITGSGPIITFDNATGPTPTVIGNIYYKVETATPTIGFHFNTFNGGLQDSFDIFGAGYTSQIQIHATNVTPLGSRLVAWADFDDNLWKYNINNLGEQHVPQTVLLSSQYTNSTTGFTTVSGMSFTVNANQKYTVQCHLYYQAAATGGLNIQFTGPASPTAVAYGLNDPSAATTFNSAVATSFATSLGQVVGTAATNFDAVVSLGLVNGANAGTVVLQAKSSAAVQLQIQAGSFCTLQ